MLSEGLGNCHDDGNDNNKERFTEQHNNSAHVTHFLVNFFTLLYITAKATALFEPKLLTQLLKT